jgi:predicted MPP superfamily phosphohydrolase
MLTFVHLSDIHFKDRDHGTQFDLDQQIRRALLSDLEGRPTGQAGYDGLLITGDIAFSGQKDEYKRANEFLDEIYARTGLTPSKTYMVPGNHDVDRSYSNPNLPLWESHEHVRKAADAVIWRDILDTQLHKDPAKLLLAPLKAYNDFAQGYGCATTVEDLAWCRVFPKVLEDDTRIRLHGLNSALISDASDMAGKLLVSEFQTAHFSHADDMIEVVLGHHPPDWLMDKTHTV